MRAGVSRCSAFWWGPARLPVLLCRKPFSPLPSASKMDSHSGSSAFPVIISHALQACLLLTELPSCGLAPGASWPLPSPLSSLTLRSLSEMLHTG